MTLDIADYKTESWTISKSVADALWVLNTRIDKHDVPAFFETIQATADDHNGDSHTPFVGIIPATDYTLAAAADKAALTGYDYGWYLTVQYVPSDERTTDEDTNPSDTITTLLGGTAWATVTGIEPHRINTVTDWTNIKKAFEFTDRCTRWKAIQEICDYCHFVFVVKWRDVSGTWRPSAYFVHEDDIDDYESACIFDGTNDYVNCGTDASLNPANEITLVAWVKTDQTTTGQIQGKQDSVSGTGYGIKIVADKFHTSMKIGGVWKSLSSNIIINDNVWHFCVATYDGSTIRTFVDGIAGATVGASGAIDSAAQNFLIGAGYVSSNVASYFDGAIGKLQTYNRFLDAAEHLQIYQGTYINRTGLVLDIPFTETTIKNAYIVADNSDKGNDGTFFDPDGTEHAIYELYRDPIGLDISAPATITDPDAYLLDGVSVKDSPEHQYNRVLATGYDAATATYFYATAQTAEVSAGTEIPIEYVYADTSLNTQPKTDARAQELLDFFQASAKIYVARFKRRMDLELYQKISFSGYNKIDTDTMRITRISYSRSAANDVVEIEFSKDQAIQQLRRLARAVNPDYVAGTLDMMNTDMSDIGLIDVFDIPIAGGTAEADLWVQAGAYVQLSDSAPINMQGWSLDQVSGVRGSTATDFSLWGGDYDGESLTEFLRWHTYETGQLLNKYIEIEEDLYINNNASGYPKIYFDIDSFRPIHIEGYQGTTLKSLELTVGGSLMMRLANYADSTPDFIGCYENMLLTKALIMDGRIEGDGNNNLVFWDNATGQKTLSELAAGGEAGDYLPLAGGQMLGAIDMGGQNITNVEDLLVGGKIRVWEDIQMESGRRIYWENYERIYADSSGDIHIYPAASYDTVYIHGNLHVDGSTT